MRVDRLLSAVVLLAITACGGSSTPPISTSPAASPTPSLVGPEGWTALATSPVSPGSSRHEDIFFLDAVNGWLTNARGEVHRTADGGATWQSLSHLPDGIFPRCVGFASATRGWIGNLNLTTGRLVPDSALWETQDGGRTWSNISLRLNGDTVVGLCGIRVIDASTVAGVGRWNGPPVFVKTTDGGQTWSSRSLSAFVTGLIDVFFFDERNGFVVGGQGVGSTEAEQLSSHTVILATSDGGHTWRPRYVSEGAGQWAWKIQFITDRVGYVTTEGPGADGTILKTMDGGATWQRLLVAPNVAFQGVAFVSPERGWVAAFPTMYSTADGGASWRSLAFGTRVNRMRAISPSLVYAAGDRVYRWTPN